MDTTLLMEPAFWDSPVPFVAGRFPGELPDLPEIAGHVLFETSGSMGRPKWIAISKRALLISAAAVNRHLAVDEHSEWGLALPLSHVGGFGVVARAFEAACGLTTFSGKWEPRRFKEWLERRDVSHISLVPTQVHDIVAAGAAAPASLTAVVVGGGHLSGPAGRAARDLGWPVLASYGMTEAGSQIATQTPGQLSQSYRPAPIPLLSIWDVGTDADQRLHISGPALFSGTLLLLEGEWQFVARDSGPYITADRVALDRGELTPLGRADARVKVLGELVDPEEIERRLVELSGGRLRQGTFAVIALADERAGHRLVAVAGPVADLKIFIAACGDHDARAAGFQRVGKPVRVANFPVGPLGKVRRTELAGLLVS